MNPTQPLPYDDFLQQLLAGERKQAIRHALGLLNKGISFEDIYEQIIRKSLYRVGTLWEQNKLSVAEEHMATSVAETVMNALFEHLISPERKALKALVGCVEDEQHQVGAKMVADVFESRGWDSFFPGAGIPVSELIRFGLQVKPDVLALSVSISFHLNALENMIRQIRENMPDLPVWVGGQAFRLTGTDMLKKYSRVTYIRDLYALEEMIDTFCLDINQSVLS